MEADGLPTQLAPKNRPPIRDEPTEPWSPNYGTVRPDDLASLPASSKVAATASATPAATPSFGSRLHPDDIIRIAIAEHEMRRN